MGIRWHWGRRAKFGNDYRDRGQLVAGGLMLGSIAACFLTRLLRAQLYGVSATDPATFAAVAGILAAAAMLASYLPARKATRVDPMLALREE